MALQFTTTRQAAQLHGVKIGVHARAGAGKTTLCSTMPDPIIISAEAGLLSLGDKDIPVINIANFDDLDDAYKFVAYAHEARHFQSVCLDSGTEIGEQCLSKLKAKFNDPRRAYGDMQDEIIKRFKWFRDLSGKHVYFSFKSAATKDDVTGVTNYGPSMPGQKVGPALTYLFDEMFSLEVGQMQNPDGSKTDFRFLRTRLGMQYEAKDRSGALDEFERPDLAWVINKILARNTATTSAVAGQTPTR